VRRTRASFALGFAAFAALGGLPSRAQAETESYQLSYSAPPGCPVESQVLKEVRANVRDAASGEGARISLTIVQKDQGFTGELSAVDRSGKLGRRRIEGATCAEVSHTLAFLAALAIELGGHVEADPSAEPAAAPPVAKPPTPPAKGAQTAPRSEPELPPARSTWRFSGLLAAGVRGGLAPSLRPALEAGVDFSAPWDRLFAPAFRALIIGSMSRVSNSAGSAKLSLLAGRFEGCPVRIGVPTLALRPCLGLELGAVFGEGELEGGQSVIQRWGSGEASLRLEVWPLQQVFVELGGAVVVPFFHTRYFFVPEQIVYVVPAVTGRAGLGVGYRFQ